MRASGRFKRFVTAGTVLLIGCGGNGGTEAGDYSLKVHVTPSGAGKITISPNLGTYVEWTDVEVKTIEIEGYEFVGWSGTTNEKSRKVSITMTGNKKKTLTANFKTFKPEFTDVRDGKTYSRVRIGNRVWMTENLAYDAPGGVCYDNDPKLCSKYGRLYTIIVGSEVCPEGWHIADHDDWLKTDWTNNFKGLPGGKKDEGGFRWIGQGGFWWGGNGNYAVMGPGGNVEYPVKLTRYEDYLSIRCVQNLEGD